MPIELNQTMQVKVQAQEIRVHVKVCDEFNATVNDSDGRQLGRYEGYVPGFFPGDHYGDYLILNINLETGQITNWVKPIAEDIEKLIKSSTDEDGDS